MFGWFPACLDNRSVVTTPHMVTVLMIDSLTEIDRPIPSQSVGASNKARLPRQVNLRDRSSRPSQSPSFTKTPSLVPRQRVAITHAHREVFVLGNGLVQLCSSVWSSELHISLLLTMQPDTAANKPQRSRANFKFQRAVLDAESPSRKDGIPLKKEESIRRMSCAYCQEVGVGLKM